MSLWEIYSLIKFICNKDFSGNIITPEKFNELIKVVNIDLFRRKYGLPEEYQPGRPVPNEHVDITLKNTDDLKAFRRPLVNTPVTLGVLPYPSDYAHRDEIVYNFVKNIDGMNVPLPRGVEILTESQMSQRRGNYTKQPTTGHPCGVLRLDGIHIYPETITAVDFYYFRFPNDPVFAYVRGDGFITYNPVGSTEFEWVRDEHLTLTAMILGYIGINLREADVFQYSELKLQKG